MITLYGSMLSRANRCAWMLKELNVEFALKPIGFQDGSTHRPEFLKINPNGRVPAIDDSGFTLFESLAINLYLCKKYKGPLTPKNIEEEALITQWSFWAVTEIEKPLLLASANSYLFSEHQRDKDELNVAMKKLSRPFDVLEAQLTNQDYLIGDHFTAADLNVASVLSLVPIAHIDISEWPRAHMWLQKCLGRPAAADWKKVNFQIPRPDSHLGILGMFV